MWGARGLGQGAARRPRLTELIGTSVPRAGALGAEGRGPGAGAGMRSGAALGSGALGGTAAGAAGMRTNTAGDTGTGTPASDTRTEPNGYGFQGYQLGMERAQHGPGYGPGGTRRALRQMQAGNAFLANDQLWSMIDRLRQESDPERLAATYAPEYERLNDQFDQATGALDRSMAARGLTDSSAMASGLGSLAAGRAQATSGLGAQIGQEARGREDMLRSLLAGLVSGNAAAAGGLANQSIQDKLARQQMQGPGFLESLLPMLGQAGMAYLGAPRTTTNTYNI